MRDYVFIVNYMNTFSGTMVGLFGSYVLDKSASKVTNFKGGFVTSKLTSKRGSKPPLANEAGHPMNTVAEEKVTPTRQMDPPSFFVDKDAQSGAPSPQESPRLDTHELMDMGE